jgi:transposase
MCVRFQHADCARCHARALRIRTPGVARTLTFQCEAEFKALEAQRRWVGSPQWPTVFDARAGIEGSFSQALRGLGLRRSRYRAEARTRLPCSGVAATVNVLRVGAWLAGWFRALTRVSPFAALRLVACVRHRYRILEAPPIRCSENIRVNRSGDTPRET